MESKLSESDANQDRAVSPVIGVILMVAITVILAAVIAAFVLDLGQSQSASAAAGVDFSEDGDVVTTQLVQIDRADAIFVRIDGGSTTYWVASDGTTDTSRDSGDDWSVGDSVRMDTANPSNAGLSAGGSLPSSIESITVIGELDGEDTVIQSWEA